MKTYIIKLSTKERQCLRALTKKGKAGARVIKRAHALLESDTGLTDVQIGAKHDMHADTVRRARQRYCDGGVDTALYDKPRPGKPKALSDKAEAYLVATACSEPPIGHVRWTLSLMRDRLIKKKLVPSVCLTVISETLAYRGIQPWREKNVVHPKGR